MLPFGVTFYPDQWPVETWEENFRQIKAAGLNIVRFNEMAWDWVEPRPGKFSFAGLDKALNLCAKHGLKVLLGIPTSQVPPWFHKKYPGSRPVAQDGTLYPEAGPRPNVCKDNPHYCKLAARLATRLARRYRNHPALAMWQLDNEPVYPPLDHTTSNDFCHCEHSRQAFIAWAKKKHGSLKKLNAVWGTKFWTNTLGDFSEIQTPKAGIWEAVSPHIFLDWFRFKTDRISDWVTHLATIVRRVDKKHKVGTNGFIGLCTRTPDHSRVAAGLDWYGLDVYPKGGKMSKEDYAFALDLWRSFARAGGAEFQITELQGGNNVRWGSPEPVAGPEIREWTVAALHHGAQAILYHAWRPPLFGAETGGFGILKADGSATHRLAVIKSLAREIRNWKEDSLACRQAGRKLNVGSIGIVSLRSSEIQTYQEQGPPRGLVGQWEAVRTDIGLLYGVLSAQGAHKLVSHDGKRPVDFYFEQDLDSGHLPCAALLLPNPYLLSLKQYKHLKKWVLAGGTLITEARFGQKDENGHLYPAPLLEDLLGQTVEHSEINSEGFHDVIEGHAKGYQLIEKKLGRGKVVYANFSLFLLAKKGESQWPNTDILIKKIKSIL